MKRCPKCRRDYYDESLRYCLDDGSALLEGPGPPDIVGREAPTRQPNNFPGSTPSSALTVRVGLKRQNVHVWLVIGAVATIALGTAVAAYFFLEGKSRHDLKGSFRELGSPAYDYYLR